MPTKLLLIIAAILQVIWGLVPSASQLVIDQIPVELYIAFRWTISGIIFLGILAYQSRLGAFLKKEAFWVALLGIGGYALASFGTLYGLKLGGVTNFAFMDALDPMIASLVAIILLKEKPARFFYIALPLCILGLSLLIVGKRQIASWQIAGWSASFLVGAAILEAVIFVYSKKLRTRFSVVQYLAISQLAAAAFMWSCNWAIFDNSNRLKTYLPTDGLPRFLFRLSPAFSAT